MTSKEFKNILSKSLYWEFDFKKINPIEHRRLVIERVVTRGNLEQFIAMMNFYGDLVMKQEVVKLKSIDKISLNFVSIIYNIPLNSFVCYGKKQWND